MCASTDVAAIELITKQMKTICNPFIIRNCNDIARLSCVIPENMNKAMEQYAHIKARSENS